MPAGRYGLSDRCQVKCHRLAMGKGQNETDYSIALRAHGAKNIRRFRLLPHDAQPCALDALVTNDKFCVMRSACLTLASSQYRAWQRHAPPTGYPSTKVGFCGGCNETPMEYSSTDDCVARRATSLEPSVPNSIGMVPLCDDQSNFAGTGEA